MESPDKKVRILIDTFSLDKESMFDDQYSQLATTTELMAENATFINKVNALIDEMKLAKRESVDVTETLTKRKCSNISWKAQYDVLLEKLEDILDTMDGDPNMAKTQFRNLDISKYESFDTYVYNNDPTAINNKKGTNERVKLLRAKRKHATKCPTCKEQLVMVESILTCPTCGYMIEGKGNSSGSRSSTDNNKHTMKQLDAVVGKKKPPANIHKIRNHISTWLTDMHFIHEWLIDNRKVDSWMEKYFALTHEHIDESFFEKTFDAIPANKWKYDVFKLFTDEIYLLLEKAKRYSRIKASNLNHLSKEEIVDIFLAYYDATGGQLPKLNDTIVCDVTELDGTVHEVEYEVGIYIAQLSLIYDTPKGSVKDQLEELYGCSLTMPGLMFNFNDIYEQSDNVPKKYNYQQEFAYITHCAFNAPFVDISQQDIASITDLILKFNSYYKDEMYRTKSKHCNAPLFCCTLICIIQNLPYFSKYAYAEECLPTKDKSTLANIKSNWFKFMCSHEDLIKPFMTFRRDDIVVRRSGDMSEGSECSAMTSSSILVKPPQPNASKHSKPMSTISGPSDIVDDVLDGLGDFDGQLIDDLDDEPADESGNELSEGFEKPMSEGVRLDDDLY